MLELFKKIREGKPALGILIKGGVQLVDFIGQAKFDYVVPDMMFSRMDWDEVNHMIRAAHAAGIGCYPRLQAYPWASPVPDRRLAVDTSRALSLQADGACMSVSGAEEVRQVVTTTADWHRGVAITSGDEVKAHEDDVGSRTLLFPLIETKSAIDEIDAIIDVEGLTGIYIAWTDFTKQVGYDFQYEHPEVLKAIDRIIQRSRKRGLIVMANTGYHYQDVESNAQRINRMAAMGVQMIQMQTTEFAIFTTLSNTVKRLAELRADVSMAR